MNATWNCPEESMFRKNVLGVFAAIAALTLGGAANAQSTDQCIQQCTSDCDTMCAKDPTYKASTSVKKSSKSAKRSTPKASETPGQHIEQKVEIHTPAPVTADNADTEARLIEAARAEERARAAEQFRSEQAKLDEQHQKDVEAARAEERARLEADLKARTDAAVARARADERVRLEASVDDDDDGALFTPFGTSINVGGGVMNYTERGPLASTNPGGLWNARLAVGTRSVIGLEGGYLGTAQDIDAVGLDEGAFLVSNGAEGALRVNAPVTFEQGMIAPYAVAGLGWQRFDLVNEGTNTSSVEDADNVMTVPFGIGLNTVLAGVNLDARAMYRHTIGSELLGAEDYSFDSNALNFWSLQAGLGFEF
jgi:hypothetical protein